MSRIYKASEVVAAYEKDPGVRNPTGFEWFDKVLGGGPLTEDLLVIGADTGVGKSRWCVSSLVYRARAHRRSLYISIEDGKRRVGERLLEAFNGVPEVEEYGRFAFHPTSTEDACDAITGYPEATMVFVDYIQDMGELDNKIIAKNLRALKEACRDIGAVCCITSQLTPRAGVDGTVPPVPKIGWLRGARELSQKADAIVMLWANEDRTINGIIGKDKTGHAGVRALMEPAFGGNLLSPGYIVTATEEPKKEDTAW